MTQPLGIDDFFTLEAGEYLDRLSSLASTPGLPNGDELVRFTRALRGSALMANQQAIARAASGLEHLVRSYRDGRRPWDTDLSALAREGIDVLRTLVERVRMWTVEDAARAERLALHLEKAVGGLPRPITTPTPSASETGVRAFLARESAALGSVLDQAARGLTSGAVSIDALQGVLRRMQPLRGLAALTDYPPLPDLLDGIERTVNGVAQLELPARAGAERLDAAAGALSRAARDIADQGRPDPEGEEFRRFAGLLLEPEGEEPAIVAIESLFFTGEDGLIQRGVTPRAQVGATLGAASVVSRGEHLCQAADEIIEAPSAPQRDLRLHMLLQDLRTLGTGLPVGLDRAVDAFAAAARSAVARGAGAEDPARFAGLIRDAGTRLRGYTEVTQPVTLIQFFRELVNRMGDLRPVPTHPTPAVAPAPPVVAAPPVAPAPPVVPAPPMTPAHVAQVPPVAEEPEIVPIEELAFDEEAAAPALASGDGQWDLAASFARYEALLGGGAVAAAAISPAPPAAAAPAPERLEPAAALLAAAPVFEPAAEAAAELPLVEITELLYHGRAALLRADQIRLALRQAVAGTDSVSEIRPLVDELLDLVELAIAD